MNDKDNLNFAFTELDKIEKDMSNIKDMRENPINTEAGYNHLLHILSHQKALYEFKNRFEKFFGEIIIVKDTNVPAPTAGTDAVMLEHNRSYIAKLRVGDKSHKIQMKKRSVTQHGSVGLPLWQFYKYEKNNILVIFALPNPTNPEYHKMNSDKECDNHSFYLLNPSWEFLTTTRKHPKTIVLDGTYYFMLVDLCDLKLVENNQAYLSDFIDVKK